MRSQFLLVILYFLSSITTAQVPQGISYQAVARSSQGQPLANLPVKVRFSILDSSAAGPVVYTETHEPVTSAAGLITVTIGTGDSNPIPFSTIPWGKNSKFLRVELDTTASGNSYLDLGTQQMMSVPYALYASASGSLADVILPTLSTDSIAYISYTSAIIQCTMSSTGNKPILVRGICISTLPEPTDADAQIITGTSSGTYTVPVTFLSPNTIYYVRAFATSSGGTSYGNELVFTTLTLSSPSIRTDSISNLTFNSAVARGSVLSDGGSPIIKKGFCIGTNIIPDTSNSNVILSMDPDFYSLISPLIPDQSYYIRSFAYNAIGISYGSTFTFSTPAQITPEIATLGFTNITQSRAIGNGSIINANGFTITGRGICVSVNPLPTVLDLTAYDNNSTNYFSVLLESLIPNTTYYGRAFVNYSGGIIYGNAITFTTTSVSLPQITTLNITAIGPITANGGGVITSDGGSSITAKGLCWSTRPNPTIANSITNNGPGSNSFNGVMTGLMKDSTYFVRAYATNNLGTAYGNEYNFTTTNTPAPPIGLPIVGTTPVTKTTANYIGGGYVSYDGASPITQQGLCWNTAGNPTINDNIIIDDSAGIGFFSAVLSIPSNCNVNYHIRAFAGNSSGISYGNTVTIGSGLVATFLIPTLISNSGNSVSISSTILSDGGCNISERGICWSVSPNPLLTLTNGGLNPFRSISGSGTGTFSVSANNLVPNTTYYFRTYAVTATGAYFSPELSVHTTAVNGLSIGQSYAGGVIFYLDSTQQHGIVCSPTDNGAFPFGCIGTCVNTPQDFGTGAQNTAIISSLCSQNNSAALICDQLVLNGYSDWYLPSYNELVLIYNNLTLNNINANLSPQNYWSSSDLDNGGGCGDRANAFNFGCGCRNFAWMKDAVFAIRAVRNF